MDSQKVLTMPSKWLGQEHQKLQECQIWNTRLAKFEECSFPIVTGISAALSVLVLLCYILKPLFKRARPTWSKAFIEEKTPPASEADAGRVRQARLSGPFSCLLGFSLIGLASNGVSAIFPQPHLPSVLLAVSWAIGILLVTIERPRKFALPVFVVFVGILIASAICTVDRSTSIDQNAAFIFGFAAAVAAVGVQLLMPLRDPLLPTKEISNVGDEPSRDARSPEDNLTLWQWATVKWMGPLQKRARKGQIEAEDVWFLGHEFQHQQLYDKFRQLKGSMIRRLMIANGWDLVVIVLLVIIYQGAGFASPIFLQQLLRAWQNPESPKSAIVRYAALMFVARAYQSHSVVFTMWFGRRAYERSRGEMITTLYQKTLSRKIITSQEDTAETYSNGDAAQANGHSVEEPAKDEQSPVGRLWTSIVYYISLPAALLRKIRGSSKPTEEDQKPASMGKILNLMRNDVYEVSQRFWEIDRIFLVPLGIIWSTALIWNLIGPTALIGVLTVVVAQVLNFILAKLLLRWEKIRRTATDSRLQATSQTIESIRHLRWYGWQQTWIDKVMTERQKELNLRIVTGSLGTLISFVSTFASGAFPVAAFSAYTAIGHNELRIDIAFPALTLFAYLESYLRELPGLITTILNAMVAIGRIEKFMNEPDKDENEQLENEGSTLALRKATFAWPGTSSPVLKDVDLSVPEGLTVVCGKVGTGKTALLQALLGELDLQQGQLVCPDEVIGYCSQSPWLESMSIRDNILFAAPLEEARYKQVLEVCALTPDLADFKQGDLSNIGENGIGLSGGQKARVALARALYSRANILLLDDPISALDHNTAESIVRKAFGGTILQGRRVVLVTHRTELCAHLATQIIEIEDNTARQITQEAAESKGLQRVTSSESAEGPEESQAAEKTKEEQEAAAVPEKFIEDEKRATGGVKVSVYWQFFKAGKKKWWALHIAALAAFRLLAVLRTWLLKEWGEAYDQTGPRKGVFHNLPNPQERLNPWLLAFLLIAIAYSVVFLIGRVFMVIINYVTAKRMFADVFDKVSHATFRYYDVTPVGRLMNRLTSDIGTMDGNVADLFNSFSFYAILWVTSIVVIASATPAFLVFSIVVSGTFVWFFRWFLPTSQNLRRLEMVSLSPLMTNFGELLGGLMTVRAYCAQGRFQARNIATVDEFQRMDHFYWSTQAWLTFRFFLIGAISNFVLVLIALYTGVSAGLTAFVLTTGSNFIISTHVLCRQYGQIEMEFTSVERVVELLHLEQEPKGKVTPPAVWPSTKGDVVFENVTIKYAPHLDPALNDVSFTIRGGSNCAIVGRTGSGKSTLAVSLLATVLPTSGRIWIDGIDISTIDPDVLRRRVTFLAQDPLLFEGTIQDNLDPLKEHTEEECAAALDRVCGSDSGAAIAAASQPSSSKDTSSAKPSTHQTAWTLTTRVENGGKNFSQGQRQLVGLARAVLRRSAIIILDEATASIDLETNMRIQRVLREEMGGSTVLTIAHRVEAVRDAGCAVVLRKGQLQEFREEEQAGAGAEGS